MAAKENWNELVSSSISRTASCTSSIIFLIFEPVRIHGSSAYRYVVGFTRDFGPSMTHCTYSMYVCTRAAINESAWVSGHDPCKRNDRNFQGSLLEIGIYMHY